MPGVARVVGSAVAQVGIQLALEKGAFNKDVQQTTKQTENAFAKTFNKIGSTTKSAFSKMGSSISNGLSKVKDNVQSTFNKISNIIKVALLAGSAYMVKFSKDALTAASETQSAWTGLNSIVVGTGGSFSKAQTFLNDYVSDGLIPLTNAVTAYKNLASRGYSTEQIEQTLTALKDAAAFGRQASYSYGDAITTATEGLKNENSILVDNAGVTKNVAKMWDDYAASIGTTANNLTQQQKIQAEVNGIMEETKFQTGDATRYADTYAGKLAKVSTAFYNLKVAVGQVIAPIAELFLPVIEKVLNALTKLFNKLKSVMAVFGLEMKEYIGKDSTSAISGATDSAGALNDNLDKSGDTAKKTAKKIKRAFSGLDELNVLNFNKNSSSSGSSGSGSGSSDTGSGDVGSSIEDINTGMEKATQNLEWLKRSAYDWGVAFGESINEGLRKIPWESIQTAVNGAVEKIAEFLNGAVAGLDWNLLGTTFGEGFNTVIGGLNTFYKTFDWDNLGLSIGEGINGAIYSIHWDTLGELIGRKFSSVFQIGAGIVKTTDFTSLGRSLGTAVQNIFDHINFDAIADFFSLGFNGVVTSISEFFKKVKWGKIGKSITNGINRAIKHLNFETVGEALQNGLNGAIDFMWQSISNFDAKKAGEQIASLINNISKAIKNTDWEKLGKTVSELLHKAFETLKTWIKETDWGELIKEIINGILKFLKGVDWGQLAKDVLGLLLVVGQAIVEGIWEGIKAAIKGVAQTLYDILIKPIVDAVKDLFGIHSPSKVFAEIGGFLIDGLWSGIEGAKKWIIDKWNGVKNWFSDIKKEAKVEIKQKWNDIKDKWNELTTNIKNKTADFKAKIATKWNDLKESWSKITSNIKNKTASMKAKIGTKWSDLSKKWSDITSKIKNKTASMKAKVSTTWSNLKTKWNNLMSHFKDKTISIKAKIGGVVGNFKETINRELIKPINNKLPSIFPSIPYLAQGSWFKKNSPQLAVVGDNKKEPEIVTPESKIYEQTKKAVENVGGTNQNQKIDFTIKLEYPDGKYLIKEINNTQIKDGKISLLI